MGMQSGKIRNSRITASSSWDKYHAPFLARLHRLYTRGRYKAAWSAAANNHEQWIEVDFTRPAKIVRIATQGRPDADQWVTSFWLSYSLDRIHSIYHKYRGSYKVC